MKLKFSIEYGTAWGESLHVIIAYRSQDGTVRQHDLLMQTDDGQIKEAFTISAGLDYPGIGPMHANLAEQGRTHVMAINDDEALQAAFELTRLEGIIPALESSHALALLPKLQFKKEDIVVLTVSGRGDKDLNTYLKHKK